MNLKRLFSILVLASLILPMAFAHGKNDVEEKGVDNLNSWQEVFDLEGKKKGKYNIMITASDLGGNTYVEGPFNLFVDPESDLCIPGITNPYPGMRVVGNLNIVGTCVDDDGVDHVVLILDGDEENPVIAEGAEFWSHYLDTTELAEGPHTIKVTGYDINGLEGKTTTVTWQLDRRQPVTAIKDKSFVENLPMGYLVSNKFPFNGKITDGNGIKELSYSIDSGAHFYNVPIKKNDKESYATFTVTVDTKQFEDGPNVLWFKATDNAGSVGVYSYLYYIDNTKPDVKIISPTPDQQMNGKFTIAGFAKDKIGITDLTWTFGDLSGEILLTPGNPYWALNFDLTGKNEKSRKFAIKAKDVAGNIVEVTQVVQINQELDKPVVTIAEPVAGGQYFDNDEIYVRGIVVDDDGVQLVRVSLDGNEPIEQTTKGDFFVPLVKNSELSTSKHKVTVTAVDVNGVVGNPVTVEFNAYGMSPEFGEAQIVSGKDSVPFVNGYAVHPEAGSSFKVDLTSTTGITNVQTSYYAGNNEPVVNDIPLKNAMSYSAVIPLNNDLPKGVVNVKVVATDVHGRTSEYTGLVYMTNTTLVKNSEPLVVFDDSTVDEEGRIVNNAEFPATGYLIGDNAKSVTITPATPFAKAELDGNQIKLIPGSGVGTSEKVNVVVTTEKGKVVSSKPLIFVNDTLAPDLTLNGYSDTDAKDLTSEKITISGKASCKTGMGKVTYRLFTSKIELKNGAVAKEPIKGEVETARLNGDGSFDITVQVPVDPLDGTVQYGYYLVEVTAESAAGNKTSKAMAFKNIPELAKPAAPAVTWYDGENVYAGGIYQNDLDISFKAFDRADMNEGANPLEFSATKSDDGKVVSSKYTAQKDPTLSASFAYVSQGGEQTDYASGMPIVLKQGNVDSATLVAYIDTGAAVGQVSYEISGDEIPGGDVKQTGNAKPIKPADPESNRWTVEIPLKNLPSRVTKVKLNIKAGSLETALVGSVQIVRDSTEMVINDKEGVYLLPSDDVKLDPAGGRFFISKDSKLYYYANLNFPLTSTELVSKAAGLKVETEGNLIVLTSEKDGFYNDVKIVVKDEQGDTYESSPVNILADSGKSDLKIVTPELHDWQGNVVKISGTAADTTGVQKIEYSLDNGENWTEFKLSGSDRSSGLGVTYSQDVDISSLEDGLIQIDVKATDIVGNVTIERTSVYKDTTPPEVTVIEPLNEDIVNGETLVVFDVKDNGLFAKAQYQGPTENRKTPDPIDITLNPLVHTAVGTDEQPITDTMSFIFTDDAGNKTVIEAWDFLIDNESDLPIAEIHVPEENQVITRDFTISGVVYDDDGASHIFYKIDDNPFAEYEKLDSSYSIDIPLSTLTDNEHLITVYAVDINGVKGPETTRKFRVSLEEPKGAVEKPTIDTSVRELITISGNATDKNGIGKVQVSLDNGNSYNDAILTKTESDSAEWSYTVDSRAIPGGTQVVFLKVTDNYEIQGLYSSLINIDNEAPKLTLELPKDDSITTGMLFFSGNSYDNVEITEMYLTIRNLQNNKAREVVRDFPITRVIGETVDITGLEDGFYNVELTAKDKAGNVTNASRNIHLDKNRPAAVVDLLYPLEGEHKNGVFNIYGQASSEFEIEMLKLYVDDKFVGSTELTSSGFFRFNVNPEMIDEGKHDYYVEANLSNKKLVNSRVQTLTYSKAGPWVTIDNFTYGDFAMERPFLRGQAGYALDDQEYLYSLTKEAPKEFKDMVAAKSIKSIEVSFDNGKTFTQLSKGDKWMYRIENQDWTEGYHFLIVRATMKNGEVAIERTIVQIDNTKPYVTLIAPAVGGRYNQELLFSGLSGDDVELKDVTLALRKGDKSSYEVPAGLQGLYVDFSFWGATLFSMGAGLTFFDDVVKVQFSWGQFTQEQRDWVSGLFGLPMTTMRYGGNVLSFKLLANIYELPFSFLFGHDWEWLYLSLALGANFAWFDETNAGKGQMLSSVVAQIEFPKVKFKGVKMFSTIALYTEGAIWVIPTDVKATGDNKISPIIPQFSIGLRANVF